MSTKWRRNLRWSSLLGFLAMMSAGLSMTTAPALADDPAGSYLPVADIRPGMTGFGLTVFSGAKIDTFNVTVVGVLPRSRAAGSLIVVEVAGHGLEQSSIAQGMSGSPIFLEGKLAGALAFGWPGALRPLGGVTPAEEILALPIDLPVAESQSGSRVVIDPQELNAGTLGALARDLIRWQDDDWQATRITASVPAEESRWHTLGEPWPAAGEMIVPLLAKALPGVQAKALQPQSWIIQTLGTDQAAGTADRASGQGSSRGEALTPGAACAVPLVLGDAMLGVTGTVTWVDGDRVFMMGHPFLQRGPVELPLATAEVLTIFPSRQMSFKMTSVGEVVGAVHHDQRAGLAGRLGAAPALIPVTVEITGGQGSSPGVEDQEYEFSVVCDPYLTPPLVFWALYNSLLVSGDDQSRQTVRYEVTTFWSGSPALAAEPLVLKGVAAGPGGVQNLASQWLAPLNILLNNPFERVKLQEVRARFEVSRPMATETIGGLVGPRVLTAGQAATFRVQLQSRYGDVHFVDFEMDLPGHLEPGRYRLAAASAAEFFALEAQRAAGRFQLSSLGGALELLRTDRSLDRLVLALFAPGGGLVMRGRELAGLPETVVRMLKSADPEVAPTLADYVWRQEQDVAGVLLGHAVQSIQIRPAADPQAGSGRP